MSSCPCWIPAATSLVTVVPYALLLLAFYIMLSRKIAQLSCGMQVRTSPGEHPSPHPTPAPAPAPGGDSAQKPGAQKPGAQNPPAAYAGSSDTSSETSEDSDSPSSPQGPGSGENIHYTSLVFPGHEPGSAQDYENIKTGMDYVNVDPKRKKINFWPFSSPRASKGVEYTEVKL